MEVILTSFNKSRDIQEIPKLRDTPFYSVSRWQPAGFMYDELDFLSACDVNGERLHLKGSNPDTYKHQLFRYYISRWDEVERWLESLTETLALCCWCPYSASTKKQIRDYKSFVCHTGLIGKLINKYRPDIDLLLDTDHHLYLYKDFKPNNYKVLDI